MTAIEWGQGPPMYDLGVDRGVLYLDEGAVPWNGLVEVGENPTGEVTADYYFEGNRLHVTQQTGDFKGLITAYTYPEVFSEYNGYSLRDIYRRFAFSYRTQHAGGHTIHLVYNVLVNDTARSWSSLSESVNPSLFSWGISTSVTDIPGASPASRLSLEVPENSSSFEELENILYGTDTTDPRMPDPAELVELYESATLLRIVYNDDGTYTASGPDDMVTLLGDGRFRLSSPSLFLQDEDIFTVSSY